MTSQTRFDPGREPEGKVGAIIAWGLYILSIPSANTLVLVGLIVAYVCRPTAIGVARQHIDAQISLFWSVFWWTVAAWAGILISIPLAVIGVGLFTGIAFALALLVLHIWFTVKSVIGLIHLMQNKSI